MTIAEQFRQEGRQEDRQKGQLEAIRTIAIRLLQQGQELTYVSQLTDLSESELLSR